MKVYRVGRVRPCIWDFYRICDILGHNMFCYAWFGFNDAIEWAKIMKDARREHREYELDVYELTVRKAYKVLQREENIFKQIPGTLEWELIDARIWVSIVDVNTIVKDKVRANGKYKIVECSDFTGEGIVMLDDIIKVKRVSRK